MKTFNGTIAPGTLLFVAVPWCQHSRHAYPVVQRLATVLGSSVDVRYVDGDTWKHKFPMVKAYPTFLYVSRDSSIRAFAGEHTLPKLMEFVCMQASDGAGPIEACNAITRSSLANAAPKDDGLTPRQLLF